MFYFTISNSHRAVVLLLPSNLLTFLVVELYLYELLLSRPKKRESHDQIVRVGRYVITAPTLASNRNSTNEPLRVRYVIGVLVGS